MKLRILPYILIGFGLAACAPANESTADLAELPSGNAGDGVAVYQTHCQVCHGVGGVGGSGPDVRSNTSNEIQSAVRNGIGVMPVFTDSQISDQQLADLIAYIDSL